MGPLTVTGDAQAAAAVALRQALAGRAEPYAAGVTVGAKIPAIRSPEDPLLPFVLVALDGSTPHRSQANTRITLRFTVWHADEDQAHDLAQLCHALMVVHRGPVIRNCWPAIGPLPAVDPDSGVPLSTFTVLGNVRPVVLP